MKRSFNVRGADELAEATYFAGVRFAPIQPQGGLGPA